MDIGSEGKPTDWKEARRLRAWELVQQGWKQQDVAAALGVTQDDCKVVLAGVAIRQQRSGEV